MTATQAHRLYRRAVQRADATNAGADYWADEDATVNRAIARVRRAWATVDRAFARWKQAATGEG